MFDRTALADQLARIYAHAGEPLSFGAVAFSADLQPWQPPVTDTDRNVGDDTSILIKAPRAVFAGKLPKQGETFTDAAGRIYRVQSLPSLPPTCLLIHFVCAVSGPVAP